MEMCILSGIYVWTKNVEMIAVKLKGFSAKLGLVHCPQLLLNNVQDCYELNGVLDYQMEMCILSGIK